MKKFVEVSVVFVLVAAFLFLAWQVVTLPGSDGGYISDEVWYVSASRNILHDFFKAEGGSRYYTAPEDCLTNGSRVVKVYTNIDVVTAEGPVTCFIRRGFPYPDKPGILNYYNLEHPPLAKYILAFVIWLRDEPIYWRLPSIIFGAATVVLVYAIARRVAGRAWAAVAAGALALDNTFRSMAGIAMLDIYLAFFTTLLVYMYVYNRILAVGFVLGLAASVKYSGAFPLFGLAYLYARQSLWKFVTVVLSAASAFLLIHMPLVGYLGLSRWVGEVAAAISWHTTSRPPGPVASTPLDWLLMQNSFMLHQDLYASGTPVYLIALIYALIRRDDLSILYLSTYGGYWLVYLAGNHTLYSFYTTHFSPLAHIILARLMADVFKKF
ncbi:MAG: phospholipid carrier-dependent glycosyltransferase [Pyrobaculum sp.]